MVGISWIHAVERKMASSVVGSIDSTSIRENVGEGTLLAKFAVPLVKVSWCFVDEMGFVSLWKSTCMERIP